MNIGDFKTNLGPCGLTRLISILAAIGLICVIVVRRVGVCEVAVISELQALAEGPSLRDGVHQI